MSKRVARKLWVVMSGGSLYSTERSLTSHHYISTAGIQVGFKRQVISVAIMRDGSGFTKNLVLNAEVESWRHLVKHFSLPHPEKSRVSLSTEDRRRCAWNHWLARSRGPRTPARPQVSPLLTNRGIFVWRGLCPYEKSQYKGEKHARIGVIKSDSRAHVEDLRVPSSTSSCHLIITL